MSWTKYIWIALIGFWACNQSKTLSLPDTPMIDVSLFSKNLPLPENTLFIDCRNPDNYADGHIPGAISIYRDELSDSLGIVLTKEQIEAMLSKKGIQNHDRLLLYDDNGSVEAARLWWVLDLYGFNKAQIIDGGLEGWKAMGLPIANVPSPIAYSNFQFLELTDSTHFADMQEVEQAIGNKSIKLLDNRSEEEYNGQTLKDGASYSGKIEGSVHLDYYNFIDQRPEAHKRLKPISEMQKILQDAGISPEDNIINYCHSGVRSALVTFVLTQLLDYPHVKNYDGSWCEWSAMHPPKDSSHHTEKTEPRL
jgi:thiosulfate/3-mercaptopyruvate sulfurtransferase